MDVKLSMITIFALSMEISGCTRVVPTDPAKEYCCLTHPVTEEISFPSILLYN